VVDTVDDSKGKYSAMGSIILVERDFFVASLATATGNILR
jgi:hypothetical protein